MTAEYDVIVAGAGMVGSALACALAESGVRVALLERWPPSPPGAETALRVSALSPASQRLLDRLGAWPAIVAHRISPYREMRVWNAADSPGIHFASAELGQPQLGWIVENPAIQFSLWRRAVAHDSLTLYCPARPVALETGKDCSTVALDDGIRLRAALVVGADGAGSRIRELAGIAVRGRDYHQRGVVATVTTERPHRETAWQRFLPGGPLAFLPLGDGRCSIVWSIGSEPAAELLALDDDSFGERLTEAMGQRLGRVTASGPRAAFPLRMQHAIDYQCSGVALIGDAAHVVHPLAGQGVNLGFADAAALAEVLLAAHHHGRPLGAPATLRRYERWRRGENRAMALALDGLERLFGSPLAPVHRLRNTGLELTDRLAPLKRQLARMAMGLGDDLPRLMQVRT